MQGYCILPAFCLFLKLDIYPISNKAEKLTFFISFSRIEMFFFMFVTF